MAELLEACMVVCFGVSWPISIINAYKARTAKGKSPVFIVMIMSGYLCGILSKLLSGRISYVFFFYCLNLVMLIIELLLFIRNKRIDEVLKKKAAQ